MLRNGLENPKNFPNWPAVVYQLRLAGHHVIQIGIEKERDIGANERMNNLPLKKISELIHTCKTWASVDNFFHHLAAPTNKKGVVIWSMSDPLLFGYIKNSNILLDRKHLRPNQFSIWEESAFNPNIFPSTETVFKEIVSLI